MKRFQSFGLMAMFALSLLFAPFGQTQTAFAAASDCGLCGNYDEPEAEKGVEGLCGNFDGGDADRVSAEKGGKGIGLCGDFNG